MYRGTCLCESIKFEVGAPFKFLGHCHCRICRKSHGANHATQGLVDPKDFKVTAGEFHLRSFASSPHYERFFCERCGTRLFNSPKDRSFFSVALNVLDGDPELHPNFHTYIRSKAPWVELRDDHPKFDELPSLP